MSKRRIKNKQIQQEKRADMVKQGTDPGGTSDYALKRARKMKGKPSGGSPFVVLEGVEE